MGCGILRAVPMTTKFHEVPDKYIDTLTCNMIYFIEKCCVCFQIVHTIWRVFVIYSNMLLENMLPQSPTIQ